MTERLVIRDRRELKDRLVALSEIAEKDSFDGEWEREIERIVNADFDGLYEGGTELPKEEARCVCGHGRAEHVMGKDYCMAGCFTNHAQAEYFAMYPHWAAQLKPVEGPRRVCARFTQQATASLIDSSVSPPQQTETPK